MQPKTQKTKLSINFSLDISNYIRWQHPMALVLPLQTLKLQLSDSCDLSKALVLFVNKRYV
jgi:hypothetical protein